MKSYKPDIIEAETPYQKAQQEWANYTGNSRVQASNWMYVAFAALGLLLISIIGNIKLGDKSSIQAILIYVSDKTGEVVGVKKAPTKYDVGEASIKSALKNFVMNIRGISTDEIVIRNNFNNALKFVTDKGKSILTEYAERWKPIEKIGTFAQSIDKATVTRVVGDSYQVDWTESSFAVPSGKALPQRIFTGIFTIVIETPKTEEKLLDNPLGIYIDEFNISEK